MDENSDDLPLFASIPDYGLIVFGLSASRSYAAADNNVFPTVQTGGGDEKKYRKVPLRIALPLVVGQGADIRPFLERFRALKNAKSAA